MVREMLKVIAWILVAAFPIACGAALNMIIPTPPIATKLPPASALAGWEVGAWVVGGLTLFFGALKGIEWMLKSSGTWEKPEAKIMRNQEEILADIRSLRIIVSSLVDRLPEAQQARMLEFLLEWPVTRGNLKELYDLHRVKLGERPAWWCAMREAHYAAHQDREEAALEKIHEMIKIAAANDEKQLKVLRAILSRLKGVEEEEL